MSSARRRSTTDPQSSTGDEGPARGQIGLSWVFPDWRRAPAACAAEPVVLGRGDDCDVVLEGGAASRRHAELRRDGPLVLLRDLGSRNGVFVNGCRVHEAPLAAGDVVRIGDWLALAAGLGAEPRYEEASDGLYAGPILGPLLDAVRRAAPSDLPIVVVGETGTGKERVARAVHAWSERAGPFIAVNCAALPESLAEAELFGYRKGAFTGAERSSPGHFRAADGGTLLLDEIIDLPLALQPKLLRVIEEREVTPLGESRPIAVDVRVVATSQESLERAVSEGRFRADLYARIDGLTVVLPPLRERRIEIPFLFLRMLERYSGGHAPRVATKLIERLCLYPMPFNVRELELLAKRLLVLHGHEAELKPTHLPERIQRPQSASEPPPRGDAVTIDALADALRAHGGVLARAAAALGISRQRAYRLLRTEDGVDLDTIRGSRRRRRARAET